MKFSVLSSVYIKENPQFLDECLKSIGWQTMKADEIILVHDGPLTEQLYDVIKKWKTTLPIKEMKLKDNVGLGKALNTGLSMCRYEYVVRVDSDDVNHPSRFEKQMSYMEDRPNLSAASSFLNEFIVDYRLPVRTRVVPVENIKQYALMRSPLNHPSTIFRKSSIENVGGYKHLLFLEDYYLWLRLLAAGYDIGNTEEALVSARVGEGMLDRRRGLAYAKSELILMNKIYHLGLSKNPKVAFVFLIRAISRFLPSKVLALVYRVMLR
ncbi:MAG: glycosyltransferase [Acidimicrobiaceae bacterium]|nr:glycosyltransferase [Acidimicrobiaceae bacterium]